MPQFFQRAWATIQTQLGKMPAGSKVLIGSLLVIMVLVTVLTLQWVGKPEMVPLMPASMQNAPTVLSRLQSSGIKTQTTGGQIFVSVEQRDEAYAKLAESDLLAPNSAAAFDDIVKNQNPWTSPEQGNRAFMLAKQKVLGQIIGKMAGVQSADVLIDRPENQGFAATHRRPSASVNVQMRNGTVNKQLVGAIAGLVAGAMAEMKAEDVVVIDAKAGRPFTVKKEGETASTDILEAQAALEEMYRTKITDMLSYIPGVIVAVNVRPDQVMFKDTTDRKFGGETPKREESLKTETKTTDPPNAEAGVKSNTGGLSIDSAATSGSSSSTVKTAKDYDKPDIVKEEKYRTLGGLAKTIGVSVNVPRSHLVRIFKQGKPADAPEPDEAAIDAIKNAQLTEIQAQIKPLISAEGEGVIAVHVIPDGGVFTAGSATTSSGPAAVLTSFDAGWMKPVGLSLLAIFSIGLMLTMARKSMQSTPMPSVQELAGVPAVLPVDDDLIGEAEASEATMAGVELNEEDMRTRKIAEQIGEMIKASPQEAAGLFSRWTRKES